ncbi:MAG: immunity protein 32 [Flavobacteriales bacterium]|nr:immunity protein 32 [Flavobacteriales bacterium]
MLTVELNKKGEAVEIFFDEAGAELLKRYIDDALKHRDHYHLMTPEWAGSELSSDRQGLENELIHHLRVACI